MPKNKAFCPDKAFLVPIWKLCCFSKKRFCKSLPYLKPARSNLLKLKFLCKTETYSNLGCNFERSCHVWNQHPGAFSNANICATQKKIEFANKNALSGYYRTEFMISFCYIWNQHSRICQNAKFRVIIKTLKCAAKYALSGYF